MLSTTKVILIALTAVAGVVTVTLALAPTPAPHRLGCGHADRSTILERLHIVRVSHCCSSYGAIATLRTVHLAQQLQWSDHGRFATSLNAIASDVRVPKGVEVSLDSDGTNWSARIPQTGFLAGHYLLTNDAIHFHESRPATPLDPILHTLNPTAKVTGAAPSAEAPTLLPR